MNPTLSEPRIDTSSLHTGCAASGVCLASAAPNVGIVRSRLACQVVGLFIILAVVARASADQGPNVLLIFTDDQGVHDVGCYGSEIETPHIDSLARDGIKFNQWYSASSICTPSRFGLLTGRNPSRSRNRLLSALMFLNGEDRTRGIQSGEQTIGAMLTTAGYRTALIGKWHLGHGQATFLPTRHGFESFFGHTGGCVDFFTLRYGNTLDWYDNERLIDVPGYATDVITDRAIEFLKLDERQNQPFFLYLAYNAPHFGKGWNDGEGETVNQLQPPPRDLARVRHITNITRRKFAAKVVNLDDAIGRVLTALDDLHLANNTLVIFMTDHGGDPRYGGSNLPYRGDKATLFEGGIRVPCLMRWPGRISAGAESHVLSWSLDIVPTLCSLCGAKPDGEIDGLDLSPVMFGQAWKSRERELYWELGSHQALQRGSWQALRMAHWKYVRDESGQEYLFDIVDDPHETRNVLSSETRIGMRLAERAKALAAEYDGSLE